MVRTTKKTIAALETFVARLKSLEEPAKSGIAFVMLIQDPAYEDHNVALTMGEGEVSTSFCLQLVQLANFMKGQDAHPSWRFVTVPPDKVIETRYARREAWRKLHCPPECGGNWSQCCPGCHGAIPDDFQPIEEKR